MLTHYTILFLPLGDILTSDDGQVVLLYVHRMAVYPNTTWHCSACIIFHMSSGQHSPNLICCSWIHECTLTCYCIKMGRDSAVGIATRYGLDGPGVESRWVGEIFHTCLDRPWGPPSGLYSGYWVFPGGKVAGAWRWQPIPI